MPTTEHHASPLPERLAQALAGTRPSRPYLICERVVTYRELQQKQHKVNGLLRRFGLGPGDRFAIVTDNDVETALLVPALLANGVAPVPLDPALPAIQLSQLIEWAQARCVLLDAALADPIAGSLPPEVEITTLQAGGGTFSRLLKRGRAPRPDDYQGLLDAGAPAAIFGAVPAEGTAYVLFTSGTTSRPKGVEISHHALAAHMNTVTRQFGYDGAACIANLLPLHHADGLLHGPVAAALTGATLLRPFRFSIQGLPAMLDSIYKHRATHFVTVPAVLALIQRLGEEHVDTFHHPGFRCVVSVAGALGAELWRGFEERFRVRVANMYGLTETVSGGLFCGPDDATYRRGTVGKAVDCRTRIVDEQGTVLAAGEVGELCIQGDNLMRGYWRDPEQTARVLREGWLYTGDIATIDAEGFHTIVGRKKNIIKRGGILIHPEEISGVLEGIPGVTKAVAFGVEDPVWGERLIAMVAPADASREELFNACRERLSRELMPNEIHPVDALPMGPSGKVVIERARALLEKQAPRADADATDTGAIYEIAARCFKVPPRELSPQSSAAHTQGWDSFAHMELITALEDHFKIRLEPVDIATLQTLGDAERIVRERSRSA